MRRGIILCAALVLVIGMIVGCGSGSDSSSSSSSTSVVNGTYYGRMNWAGRHWDKGSYTTDHGYYSATLQQDGNVITGTWEITDKTDGHYVTSGIFENATINGNVITGIMQDYGIRFDEPFSFTGSCDGNTFSGSGVVSWCGHWDTDWSCPKQS